jgi:hypothetical protein
MKQQGSRIFLVTLCVSTLLAFTNPARAQIAPSIESLSDMYPGKAYSPYAERNFPDRVFWGDTHLHTGLSVDAGLFGARLHLADLVRPGDLAGLLQPGP